jgi:hypothetical protein
VRISKRTGLALALLSVTVVPFAWAGLAPAKTNAPRSKQVGCGIERWSVKTLADPAGRTLSLSPKATTIRALRNRTVPGYLGLRRSRGVERTTFRVQAKLVEMKLEADSDIHLVIADPTRSGATLIAEFPLATCTARATPRARLKIAARPRPPSGGSAAQRRSRASASSIRSTARQASPRTASSSTQS